MKLIKNIEVDNVNYSVVKFKHEDKVFFGTVDFKYIKNNKLTQNLNGLQMLVANTEEQAIQKRKQHVENVKLMQQLLGNR